MNTNTYAWLIRRELWENRAIWMIPALVAGLIILAALFGQFGGIPPEAAANHQITKVYLAALAGLFYAIAGTYASWYLLDCLYDDRKDRSVLFWKSLPISDTETVLSKLAVALVVAPLIALVIADVTSLIAAFILSMRFRSELGSSLWQGNLWLQIQVLWLYVVVSAGLWYLPLAGWLLLVSAWCKRAVLIWSVLPPIAVILAERLFFGTYRFNHLLSVRLWDYPQLAFHGGWFAEGAEDSSNLLDGLNVGGLFGNAQLWIGVLVGIAMIVGAIQLRMRRSEI
jgi:ABC-2 type transport system permease protein